MPRRVLTIVFAALLCAAAPRVARSADGLVLFNGTILATCVLTVGTPGILAANADYSALSSSAAGGAGGLITVLTTGSAFKVSALAPSAFTLAPSGGGDNVTFATSYSGSGATTIAVTPGATETSLNVGLTIVTVDLTAAKSAGHYAGGNYTATVTVRCE